MISFSKVSISNIKNKTNSFFSLFWLMFVRLFSSPSTLFFFFVPFIFLLSYVLVAPLYYSGTLVLNFSLLFSSFFIYGIFFFNIRKSTIYNFISLDFSNKKGKANIYGSIFFLILVFNIIFSFVILFILLTLNNIFNLNSFSYPIGKPIMSGLHKYKSNYLFDFNSTSFFEYNFGIFIYYVFLTTILTFSISFLFQGITSNFKGYMIISVIYIFSTIIFGSTLISSFNGYPAGTYYLDGSGTGVPRFVFDNSSINSISFNKNSDTWYVNIYLQQIVVSNVSDNLIFKPKGFASNFSSYLWIFSQFLPQNFLNSLFFNSFLDISYSSSNILPETTKSLLYYIDGNGTEFLMNNCKLSIDFFSFNSFQYFYLFFIPYGWILFYLYLGGILNSEN